MELVSNAVLYFHKGGFVMYLLLVCSLFVVSIAIERSMFFSKMDAGRKFAQSFYDFMTQQKYAEAAEAAKNANGILRKEWCCYQYPQRVSGLAK